MTMTKKEYIAPAFMVFEIQAENTLAVSLNDEEYEGPELSNKREPVSSPWDSSNWSTKE